MKNQGSDESKKRLSQQQKLDEEVGVKRQRRIKKSPKNRGGPFKERPAAQDEPLVSKKRSIISSKETERQDRLAGGKTPGDLKIHLVPGKASLDIGKPTKKKGGEENR